MSWYARFYEDLKDDDGNVLYLKDSKRNKTRYAIIHEDEEKYYISMKPNDPEYSKVCSFNKISENKIYFLVEE